MEAVLLLSACLLGGRGRAGRAGRARRGYSVMCHYILHDIFMIQIMLYIYIYIYIYV